VSNPHHAPNDFNLFNLSYQVSPKTCHSWVRQRDYALPPAQKMTLTNTMLSVCVTLHWLSYKMAYTQNTHLVSTKNEIWSHLEHLSKTLCTHKAFQRGSSTFNSTLTESPRYKICSIASSWLLRWYFALR
jgi:hypothetical protein